MTPPPNSATSPSDNVKDDQFIVKFKQNFYNIATFLKHHPGGTDTLQRMHNTDITEKIATSLPHSDAALYLLNEYKVSGVDSNHNSVNQPDELNNENPMIPALDDSMEHLVEWNKAMFPQISKIVPYYHEWVHKPVDRSLRLFDPWYLEMFTKTPWWIIPSFWLPIILACLKDKLPTSWNSCACDKIFILMVYFSLGILCWTFIEYSVHRWLFHIKTTHGSSPVVCSLHFILHGLHHKVPFDSQRLVFPPLPAAILALAIYMPLSYIVPNPQVVLSGGLFGYVCYDLMHYYLHYGNPDGKYLYHMKRYHYQHHFAHQGLGYGISSPLWDWFFNTRIKLRKLAYKLRWN